ncbi:hypothetical protein HY490_05225 [Candidatus Woesearchaeota archaeon]|nr:hypothetical protein [Candidatus Woesearchaeota archaeon]
MIVTLIITIIIFMGAISLTFKFFKGAEEVGAEIERSTKEQISGLLRSGNQLVAIPFNKATLPRGKQTTFAIGVRNIGDTAPFSIKVEFDNAYDLSEKQLPGADKTHIEDKWVGGFAVTENIRIEKNKFEIVPIPIKSQGSLNPTAPAPKGIYVFNICVYKKAAPDAPCQLGQPVEAFYDKRIHQVFIEV